MMCVVGVRPPEMPHRPGLRIQVVSGLGLHTGQTHLADIKPDATLSLRRAPLQELENLIEPRQRIGAGLRG